MRDDSRADNAALSAIPAAPAEVAHTSPAAAKSIKDATIFDLHFASESDGARPAFFDCLVEEEFRWWHLLRGVGIAIAVVLLITMLIAAAAMIGPTAGQMPSWWWYLAILGLLSALLIAWCFWFARRGRSRVLDIFARHAQSDLRKGMLPALGEMQRKCRADDFVTFASIVSNLGARGLTMRVSRVGTEGPPQPIRRQIEPRSVIRRKDCDELLAIAADSADQSGELPCEYTNVAAECGRGKRHRWRRHPLIHLGAELWVLFPLCVAGMAGYRFFSEGRAPTISNMLMLLFLGVFAWRMLRRMGFGSDISEALGGDLWAVNGGALISGDYGNMRLFLRTDTVLVVSERGQDYRVHFVVQGSAHERGLSTWREVDALLAAWLSPLKPPSREHLEALFQKQIV